MSDSSVRRGPGPLRCLAAVGSSPSQAKRRNNLSAAIFLANAFAAAALSPEALAAALHAMNPALAAEALRHMPADVQAYVLAEMPMKDGVAVADAVMQLVELHVVQPELGLVEPLVLNRAQGVAVVRCQNLSNLRFLCVEYYVAIVDVGLPVVVIVIVVAVVKLPVRLAVLAEPPELLVGLLL